MNKTRRQESAARKAPERPAHQAMRQLVERVAADARVDPERYLRESRVPAGGE